MAIKRLCDVESHLGNSIDSLVFCVTNDHWNVRKVASLEKEININQAKRQGKGRRVKAVMNQGGLRVGRLDLARNGWEGGIEWIFGQDG